MSNVTWKDLNYSRFYVCSVYCSWKIKQKAAKCRHFIVPKLSIITVSNRAVIRRLQG